MFVDSELQPDSIAIFRNSIKAWNPPHDCEPIDEKTRDRILENVKLAFESKGDNIDLL
jgi:hypothetical protein